MSCKRGFGGTLRAWPVPEWPTRPLGEVLELLIDHRGKTVKKLGGDFQDSGVRVLSAKNIKGSRIDDENLRYVSEEMFRKWMPNELRKGDVLLTSEAPLGEVAYLSEDLQACLGQRLFALRADDYILDGRYLFYALSWGPSRDELLSRATGTTVVGIRQAELIKIGIALPPLPEQRAIAEVLGALDDKIESNRRVVDCGTSLIQAEFDSAKSAADTQTSLREEISSPRGIVQTGPFGSNLHASDYADEGTPLLLVKHVLGGLVRHEALPLVSQDKASELEAYKLALNDIVITRVGRVGDAALIGPAEVGWMFSGQMLRIKAVGLSLDPFWLAAWFLSPAFKEVIDGYAVGSTRQSLSTGILLESPMPKVPIERQVQFRKVVEPIQGAIWNARSESIKLAQLRDTLLPALLSGRIRVPAAAELVEAS